ncbi:MAG TPA: hypothetical protein VJ866_14270 [Pyrinomonadaceae bacterium]|nr:hypothetical protein [Pyrinomonadaceae bacterium]
MSNTYWLFNWLDSHGVDSLPAAERALSEPSQLEDLREVAILAKESLPAKVQGEAVIVAGRGLDLSDQLSCSTSSCRQRQVDELYRKAWHYFDRIVVDDSVSHNLIAHWDITVANPKSLLSDIEVLLYLREVGAEDLLEFRQKPNILGRGWRDRAIKAGLKSAVDCADKLIDRLAKESEIKIRPYSKGVSSFTFKHPRMEITYEGRLPLSGVRGKPTSKMRIAVARRMVETHFPYLTSDIQTSVSLGVPLGCANWFHGEILSSASEAISPATTAFSLDLPVLQGIPIQTLVQVRHDEYESFQRFRDSLRLAIQERLKHEASGRVTEVGEQIRMDVIEPELRRIRDRLAAAEKALAKKSAVGIFMGALVTTCGILAGLPIPVSIAAGVGTASSTETGAVSKYLEEKQQVALSDMYFLWRAVKHAAHNL